jgi:hypothetical protein
MFRSLPCCISISGAAVAPQSIFARLTRFCDAILIGRLVFFGVITGLDPVIHPLRKILVKIDGCAGQARA